MHIKRQIRRLLALEFLGNFKFASAAWVLLLTARGYSLAEVGLAEGFFHLVSLCCEVPSGIVSDVLGRKRTLTASHLMFACSALLMIASRSLGGVLLSLALNALGYNLASGTREAITYDSLAQADAQDHYLRVSSWQNILWRLAASAALLCAGFTLRVGHVRAYGWDLGVSLAAVALCAGLVEPVYGAADREGGPRGLAQAFRDCAAQAGRFLLHRPRVMALMLFNAAIGASATLLRFFLQDGLKTAGASAALLGPLLLGMELGGVAGSRLAPLLGRLSYRTAAALCTVGQVLSLGLAFTGCVPLMAAGGFLAALCDDALQLLTDAKLNAAVPSGERATLLSVSSMCFSLVMLVASPVSGALLAR